MDLMRKRARHHETGLLLLHAPSVYDFRKRAILYGPVSDMVPSSTVFEMYPLGFTTMAARPKIRWLVYQKAMLGLNGANFSTLPAVRRRDGNPW